MTSEQPTVKGTYLWGSRAERRTASQKGWYLCLIGTAGSRTQAVGLKVHLWAPDLLRKYRQWNTAGFVSISYVWRKSPYFAEIEHNTISSFWPSLIAGFDAAYEVDNKDRVLFFKGTPLTFPSVFLWLREVIAILPTLFNHNGMNIMLIFILTLILILALIEHILNI